MVKSKDWQNALARTLRWRYLVLDEGELCALRCSSSCPAWSWDAIAFHLHCEATGHCAASARQLLALTCHAGHKIKNEETQLAHAMRLIQ